MEGKPPYAATLAVWTSVTHSDLGSLLPGDSDVTTLSFCSKATPTGDCSWAPPCEFGEPRLGWDHAASQVFGAFDVFGQEQVLIPFVLPDSPPDSPGPASFSWLHTGRPWALTDKQTLQQLAAGRMRGPPPRGQGCTCDSNTMVISSSPTLLS